MEDTLTQVQVLKQGLEYGPKYVNIDLSRIYYSIERIVDHMETMCTHIKEQDQKIAQLQKTIEEYTNMIKFHPDVIVSEYQDSKEQFTKLQKQ